jgi:hypothetical protein
VFWYFRTAFLREFHHGNGEDLRSTETILHLTRRAKQGGFQLAGVLDPLATRSVRRASDSVQTALPESTEVDRYAGQFTVTPLHDRLPEINPPRFQHRSTVMRLGPQAGGGGHARLIAR